MGWDALDIAASKIFRVAGPENWDLHTPGEMKGSVERKGHVISTA